ncbi:MAG: hypothetical protein OXH99_10540 [Bryobacterales bacterium]|nr:hypothetical protein [Bryobacterales bacterium]
MTLRPHDSERYERWRSQWLAGHDSQAQAVLRWHGLALTLLLTAPRAAPGASRPGADAAVPASSRPAALAAAARQMRAVRRRRQERAHA